jgi:F0F1-type ATP synthase membrane subunit b/b'
MESTLHDLGGLLLKAIPTAFLLLVVHLYLKSMFFRPMADVLAKRRAATEGQRESAAALRAKAEQQMASIEAQLRQAREEIYQEQEEARRRWTTEQTSQLDQVRGEGRDLIRQGKERLDAEAATAKSQLSATADGLADQIVRTLLERSAA